MGKRQRARERATRPAAFESPLLAEFASRMKAAVIDGQQTHGVTLDELAAATAEALRVVNAVAEVPPPLPTQMEMLTTAALHAARVEFPLGSRIWNRHNGKEARVFDIKFDRYGLPSYRVQYHDGRRFRHHAAEVHKHLSAQRIYFPVDIETGRFILPARTR